MFRRFTDSTRLRPLGGAIVLLLAAEGLAGAATVDLVAAPRGTIVSEVAPLADPSQTYELYLPTRFDPRQKWPLLLIFDPRARGRDATELFRPAAEEFGWILAASNRTASDGLAESNQRAINAMFPDVMRRLPVDERRIHATGFSGGAVLSWTIGLLGGKLAGVISVCGRPAPEHLDRRPNFAFYAATGRTDFNYLPTLELMKIAEQAGVRRRLEVFDGPHAWFPPALARQAIAWLELGESRAGLATLSAEKTDQLFAEERAAAEALLAGGDPIDAERRARNVATAFRGLAEVGDLERRADELAKSSAYREAVKAAKAAERYETLGTRRIAEASAAMQREEPPTVAALRHQLGLEELLRRASESGAMGDAAHRLLARLHSQFSFYLVREWIAAGDYRRALPALEVATEARPEDPFGWYNFACVLARSNAPERAIAALGRALDAGLPRPEQMATDEDLASLRGRTDFAALLARARIPATTP